VDGAAGDVVDFRTGMCDTVVTSGGLVLRVSRRKVGIACGVILAHAIELAVFIDDQSLFIHGIKLLRLACGLDVYSSGYRSRISDSALQIGASVGYAPVSS